MNIDIHSNDLNRMAKVLSGFADPRFPKTGNVEIIHEDSLLKMRATNSILFCEMTTPLLGGNGENVCVDAKMLNSVAGMQGNRMVNLSSDDTTCTVKGNGRTKMKAVSYHLPEMIAVNGNRVTVKTDDLKRAFDKVIYAVCTNENRIELTGIHVKSEAGKMMLTTLDGFQMARETIPCEGEDAQGIVPVHILKTICSAAGGDVITFKIDSGRIQVSSDGISIAGGLVAGTWPNVDVLIPQQYSCEAMFSTAEMNEALRAAFVVENKNLAIRLKVENGTIHMSSQGNNGEFDAEIPCEIMGEGIEIAFASNYLQNALKCVSGENAVIRFSSTAGPAVIGEKDDDGIHLTLPVRLR